MMRGFLPIQVAVCHHFGMELTELVGKDCHKSVAFARQMGMYLCRIILGMSLPEIGSAFGSRHHTTVLHGVRRIHRECRPGTAAQAHLDAIVRRLV